jgi:transcriptional regulator with PAS, ATPase and Fis domain
VLVGSSPECELHGLDPRMSRRHCQLSMTPEGVALEDLGSKNGTLVAGVRVGKVWLSPGQTVTVGSSRLEVLIEGEGSRIPLSSGARFGAARGASVAMRALFAQLERAAQTESTLLLWGETGTGKELLARGVHEQSPRSGGPFVVFDCGAALDNLLEDALFGHEAGAFTGAETAQPGAIERAEGGTLFLDEIGELPLAGQTNLLRALEQRTVRRLGSLQDRPIDLRVIAATHRDLRTRVASGQFRQDLFFRLAVLELTVPPLRQRLEDLPLLIEGFLSAQKPPRALASLPGSLIEMFKTHAWPGNVRELRNAVERLTLFPELDGQALLAGPRVAPEGAGRFSHLPLRQARDAAVEHFEREYFRLKLAAHGGSVAAAAEEMGVSRQFVYRMLARYDLRPDDG